MDAAARPVGRERGWRPIVAAVLVCLAIAAVPAWPPAAGLFGALVRLAVPVEQTILLVAPAVAACATVGWWAGGRVGLAVVWLALGAWVIAESLPAQAGAYGALARGWALLLAGAFGVACIMGARRPFLVRALSALGVAVGVALGALVWAGAPPARLAQVMTTEYERRVSSSLGTWERHTRGAAWQTLVERTPELAARAEGAADTLRVLPGAAAVVVPALLALESLGALGLAWALFHRLSRVRLGAPLAPLKAFRFSDQLVWALVVGATLALLPTLAHLRSLGLNLLIFFGALYALRGLGVLRWWAPTRAVTLAVLGMLLLLLVLGPVLVGGTLVVVALALGLGDTWGDWRNRPARPTS